ncbi:tetratricopeptide repeat protein [Candidatus Liberibacter solanacearum]|uniref:Tetratricopeptide repeat protein n=1 Tax=Candidatus Liberibacter solanacearum TaxID=556287 RepID=A0A424FNY1_9HYPH|nr:tetratricopeptide repeat protein [Candidatus Liberibacter solanacearum]RPD37837.1 tetratricopeptide repeat protein [Candidatus Liberibacter solanacearum]
MIRSAIILLPLFLVSSCGFFGPRISVPDLNSLENMSHKQLLNVAFEIGETYRSHPKNKKIGIMYSDALRRVGRTVQALAVMRQVAIVYPKDQEVLAAYGKALANAGYLEEALDAVDRSQRPDMPDWRLISSKASILAQMGKYSEALVEYNRALELAPNEPSIISNMAMSYLLTGDLQMAEKELRYAAKMVGADSRIRQNLALVIGLQGRTEEAYDIASNELSPEEAKENINYIKSILAQKDPWKKMVFKETHRDKKPKYVPTNKK